MAIPSKCPVCREIITLTPESVQDRLTCPACGVRLTTSENGDLAVEAIRPAATSNLASVPKPPPKLEDTEEEDEWDEDIPRHQPWRRRFTRAAALKKVKAPAIFLQILGAVWIIAAVATIVISLFIPEGDPDYVAIMSACIGGALLGAGLGVVTILAGTRMKALRNFPLILTVLIMTMALGVLACLPLAVVPIWPLVVLVGSDVRAGFEANKEEGAKPETDPNKDNAADE